MKISVIISSYNQRKRLRHCLDSAIKMKCKMADDIELIVADDNSTDGSRELIRGYKDIKMWCNESNVKDKYTLTSNWNDAVLNIATGDRVLFTNGDHVLTTWFADHHADAMMCEDIIFGPGYQTHPDCVSIVENDNNNYMDVINACSSNDWVLPDRHIEGSAHTYNVEWPSNFPYGYNFSVRRDHFIHVGGFEQIERWGGEEQMLCDKIVKAFPHVRIVSNCNSSVIHMYHHPHNLINRNTGELVEYNF